ncbi:MAG: helix-turn-helix domain-containing protein [Bacteroidales bacterium]|nr:helix-turn-helix domain-containing protein [Bacteroidales bacterium]
MKMPKTHTISKEQAEEIRELRKTIKDKQTDKRLKAVQLRGEGKKNKAIADQLETSTDVVSHWISLFVNGGIEAVLPKARTGRPLNLSYDEEEKLLAEFEAKAESGQIIEVSDIKAAYQEKVGHTISSGQIYYVLKRHSWRKVKPRSRHPKKASPEVIETSKKLTLESKN